MTGLRARLRGDLGGAIAAAALSLVAVTLVMRLWRAELSVPFAYTGDATFFLGVIKATLEHGWYLVNEDLGAPFGQELYDFPVAAGDNLNVLIVKVLGLFSDDPAAIGNVYFVGGFALAAVSAFLTFRALDVARGPAIACSVLFALLPLHFIVGETQPFISTYFAVPPACFLVLAILTGRPLFERAGALPNRLLAFASRRTLLTIALCVLVGSAGGSGYYPLFTVGLVVVAALLAALRERGPGPLAAGAVVAVAIAGTVTLNALPTLLYRAEHGENDLVAQRQASESEDFSLSLAALVLPIRHHRIGPLDRLRERYEENSPLPAAAAGPGLGAVSTIGLLWLLGFGLAALVGAVRLAGRATLYGAAAAATLTSILIATTGGFSVPFAYIVSPQLRVWERFYPLIAFFCLLAVALLLEAALRRLGAGRARTWGVALLAAVTVLGVIEQTGTSESYVPRYSELADEYRADRDFVAALERELPEGASVFELPYVRFPEGAAPGPTTIYDHMHPWLHSEDLRWSFGAMEGRPEDWQPALVDKPLGLVVPSVAAAGFDGIMVDRLAYPDRAAAVERALRELLVVPPVTDAQQRRSFFDLRPYRARLVRERSGGALARLRAVTLRPVKVEPLEGLGLFEPYDATFTPTYELTADRASLLFENPSNDDRFIEVSIRLLGHGAGPKLRVGVPGASGGLLEPGAGMRRDLVVPQEGVVVTLEIVGATGTMPVRIVTELRDSPLASFPVLPAGTVSPQPLIAPPVVLASPIAGI